MRKDEYVEQKIAVANEFDFYMKSVRPDRTANSNKQWSANEKQYPSFAEFANLATPISSCIVRGYSQK